MNRFQRAIGFADMDAYARSVGLIDAEEYVEHLQLHRRLDTGGRLTAKDIERTLARSPNTSLPALNRLADWVNAGATGRDRADRYCDAVADGISRASGRTVDYIAMRDTAREEAENFASMEVAVPLTERLNEADIHRDRQSGIDREREHIENARRAAMTPEAIRRADIEREVNRHQGHQPTLYAQDRRELLAKGHDRIGERIRAQGERNMNLTRDPARGDDRRSDIALEYDRLALEARTNDELNVAANPLLESLDDAATYADATQAE